jgi:type II secretory pathway component GspD/PulD (secretin)
VVLLPIPRQNAILVAAPEARLKDVEAEIAHLDVPNAPPGKATAFPLKKASAARVDAMLNSFYAARYSSSGETQAVDQVRITHEDSTNTVYVQAAPADLAEISDIIARIDTSVSAAVNEIQIVPLKNVTSDEMQAIIQQAINQATAVPTTGGTVPGLPTTPGGPGLPTTPTLPGGARPGGLPTPTGPTGVPGTPGAIPGTTGVPATPQATTKATTLRFVLPTPTGLQTVEAGMLEDVHLTSFPRLNALLIAAPEKSMPLLRTLIAALDTLPNLRAELKVFTLSRADASATAILLQQLFLGVGGIAGPTTVTPGGGPGAPGVPGAPGGVPGAPGAVPGGGTPRQITPLVVPGISPEGAPLIELRLAVDTRTNSIIVAGSPNDVFAIELIIRKLEDTEVQLRRNMVYHVRNSSAADLANAITTFSTSSLQVLTRGGILTPYQDILREVVVVPEPITNKLLISATPQYYEEAMRLITELDAEPPQVVIQVLIAEVDLNNTDEFGVEIGLQSPVVFQRGVFPAPAFSAGSTSSFTSMANAAGMNEGPVPFGTNVSTSNPGNPVGQPGFLFNTTNPLGNNVAVNPGVVGYQGLTNLGVGRISPNAPVGGFVFSAASDTFNLLIRALKTQGRMEILSRPQLMTLDNQTASVQVGQKFPYLSETSATLGTVTSGVTYENTGVILNVTPRISPDGKVLMRVNPAIETPLTQINLGGGFLGTPFAIQTVTTTVLAGDGETVAIGGLIQKRDNKTESKIPWLGDLPGVGVLFRFREQIKAKTELLIILTPHIVRSRAEADLMLDMEAKRMDWTKVDVVKTHGTPGIPPILPPAPPLNGPAAGPGPVGGPAITPSLPAMEPVPLMVPPTPVPSESPTKERVPAPEPIRPSPGVRTSAKAPAQRVSPAAYTTAAQAAADPPGQAPAVPPSVPPTAGNGQAILPASKDSEKSKWSIMKPWTWVGKDID